MPIYYKEELVYLDLYRDSSVKARL